jgi:hypothetical protein
MAARRIERESLAYIDCEVPEDMTLREWRGAKPADSERPRRVRAAAAAVGRAARLRRRVD